MASGGPAARAGVTADPHSTGLIHTGRMEPGARVAWVVETAKAVIERRLSAEEGAAAVRAQQAQLIGLLRQDRNSVTRRECDTVSSRLRLLAEQVSDAASSDPDNAAQRDIARALGEFASALR